MEQKTYEQVLASIDPEKAVAAIAGMMIYLGGRTDWGSDEWTGVVESLDGARPAGMPPFYDQDDDALTFWGSLSYELGNETDYEPPQYVATISVPGYLPMDDDPPVFDTAAEAWDYLREERQRAEDDDESTDEYSETLETLGAMATGGAQLGSIVGPTPGYDGDHDLGLVYAVRIVEED
jgi:hypothetical protein